jgi:hypothetical protein
MSCPCVEPEVSIVDAATKLLDAAMELRYIPYSNSKVSDGPSLVAIVETKNFTE